MTGFVLEAILYDFLTVADESRGCYLSLNNFLSKVADWIQLYGDSLQPFSIF